MSDEVERRIEEAAQQAKRERETAEFLQSLTRNDELVKPVYNPEAFVMRAKIRGAAERGELKRTGCSHPLMYIEGYVDRDPQVHRDGKPINLFECGVCHAVLWLVDGFGNDVPDG